MEKKGYSVFRFLYMTEGKLKTIIVSNLREATVSEYFLNESRMNFETPRFCRINQSGVSDQSDRG